MRLDTTSTLLPTLLAYASRRKRQELLLLFLAAALLAEVCRLLRAEGEATLIPPLFELLVLLDDGIEEADVDDECCRGMYLHTGDFRRPPHRLSSFLEVERALVTSLVLPTLRNRELLLFDNLLSFPITEIKRTSYLVDSEPRRSFWNRNGWRSLSILFLQRNFSFLV